MLLALALHAAGVARYAHEVSAHSRGRSSLGTHTPATHAEEHERSRDAHAPADPDSDEDKDCRVCQAIAGMHAALPDAVAVRLDASGPPSSRPANHRHVVPFCD